jgi:exodeoxyribonuclease V gamma subunit
MKPFVYVSNDSSFLEKRLINQVVTSPSPPFSKKIVLLPSLEKKNRLLLSFLKEVDVVMGIDFMELGSGLELIYHHLTGKILHFPPLDLLALHILPLLDTKYSPKQRQGVALALAKTFLDYGKFGFSKISDWEIKKGWQQQIWKEVFSKWNRASDLLNTPLQVANPSFEIHLYQVSFLPNLYHEFFENVSKICPVYYYQFSPCSTFWTDVVSEKERIRFEKGADPKRRAELSSYLQDRPYLLAQLGKLSSRTFRFFEERDFPIEELYHRCQKKSLLEQLQMEILNYETSQEWKKDESILLYPAGSKRREVEILYKTLLSCEIDPADIRVYAPDISQYAPWIRLIFGGKESPFRYTISDLPKKEEAPLLQAFLDLLSLNEHRFHQKAVLKLLTYPPILKKLRVKGKEVTQFKKLIEKSGVRWGVDRAHQTELLEGKAVLEEGEIGTWEGAFHQLLVGLTKVPEKPCLWEPPLLDFSDAEMVGKLIGFVRNLKKDLVFLEKGELSLKEWGHHLSLLLYRYFEVEEEELSHFNWIEGKLRLLESSFLPDTPYSWEMIFEHLKRVFEEKRGKQASLELETISFSSLKLGSIDTASLICLLGLDENQFPRVTLKNTLSEIELDQSPLHTEEDRHLFLEALFAAKTRLIMSYVSMSEEDGKEQAPSSIVQELISYLSPLSIIKESPPFSFHQEEFTKEQWGSLLSYKGAKAFYSPSQEFSGFIPEFQSFVPLPDEGREDLVIELKDLARFAKNPLRFYFNEQLGLYLEYETKDEEFSLSPLNQMVLRNQAHTRAFDQAFKEAEKEGKLPQGRFKEVARLVLDEQLREVEKHLLTLKVDQPSYLQEIDLTISLGKGRKGRIKGTLDHLTSQGLLFFGEKTLTDLVKIWPIYLVSVLSLNQTRLLLTKTGQVLTFPYLDPENALVSYLLYYEKGGISPSPFLPSLASSFLEKGEEDLEKKLKMLKDPYASWALCQDEVNAQVIFSRWAPFLKQTFHPLYEEVCS